MPTSRPRARVLRGTPRNLARLARALAADEVVGVPTETVYGLAGHALSEKACGRIFRAKGRPTNDPLIVHIHRLGQWEELAEVTDEARRVAAAFWPGPLTIVLPKRPIVPDLCTSGLPSVAVRMPAHPVFRALLRRCGLPLAAPSANPFGYLSPTTAAHVVDHLGRRIPFVLEGGPCAIGVESTILDLRNPRRPAVLRPGAISTEQIAAVLGRPVRGYRARRLAPGQAALAPGLLTQHYSPHTPLTLHPEGSLAPETRAEGEAILVLRRPSARVAQRDVFWLSRRGSLREAARLLFARLQSLDTKGYRRLHVEVPNATEPLAVALRDRLTRAAARR